MMKMKLTLHLCTALCVRLTCAQSVLKLLILRRHWQSIGECLWLINLMRKPCAVSTRYTPLSLFAWKKVVKPVHLCAVSARNMGDTTATRYGLSSAGRLGVSPAFCLLSLACLLIQRQKQTLTFEDS